jgi:hypothetical protein
MTSAYENKAAVLEHLARYSGAAGRKDSAELARCFTEDCEVWGIAELVGATGAIKGPRLLAEIVDSAWVTLGWVQQINTTTDVSVDDSQSPLTAKAVTNLIETAQRKEGGTLVLIGRYHDDLVLTDEGWRFRRRRMEVFDFRTVAA